MKKQTITSLLIAFSLVFSASLFSAPKAEAACSYNGYINSGGACAVSYKNNNVFSNNYSVQNQVRSQFSESAIEALIAQLEQMIAILQDRLEDNYYYDYDYNYSTKNLSITTLSATDIEEDEATLRGRISLNREDEAEVYFEYGDSRYDLDEETSHKTIDDNDKTYTFSSTIDDLDEDTLYYFRAVAEDEDGDEHYGAVFSFRTDDDNSNNDDEPELNTYEAEDVDENSAELNGFVDMNDFNNGKVFFVYGEDESQVEDVEDDYDQYSDIDEDGDDLQKTLLDNDLDSSSNYHKDVYYLNDNTDIYYSICVEFEDEDNDDKILCGDIESFETDEE